MTDWADAAAKETLEAKVIRDKNVEKSNRDAKIKAEIGPQLFGQLKDWLTQQIDEYNSRLAAGSDKSDELYVKAMPAPPSPAMFDNLITVGRLDGKKGPLKIQYSVLSGILSYDCGSGQGQFLLEIDDNGGAVFKNPYHQAMSIEEMGEEMLL